MPEDSLNYGIQREYAPAVRRTRFASTGNERAWSALAHLSIFLNLVTGFLGPVAALGIWLAFRDRPGQTASHALQSLWYQTAWLVILATGWSIAGILTIILIGFLLLPVMALLSVVPFAHAAYAAYRVGVGDDYRYLRTAKLLLKH